MRTLITGLFLLLTFAAYSQTQGFTGHVTETGTNDTLVNVAVRLRFTPYVSLTPMNGSFCFENVPAGKYMVQIEEEGYESITDTVTVIKGQLVAREYKLVPVTPIQTTAMEPMKKVNTRKSLK